MLYTNHYSSPLGSILLAADDTGLTGLWFEGQKYYAKDLIPGAAHKDLPVFRETTRWLNLYFQGKEPDFCPALHPCGTAFQKEVWEILLTIPYGKTMTYGEIAAKIAERNGLEKMSARAVGSAVGKNKISLLIPCHRVVGAGDKLTGYAGGVERKEYLLNLEKR